MTGFTRHDLPADIVVHAGNFDNQPAVFAHLLTDAPGLDLTHIEVLQGDPMPRLCARFSADTAADIAAAGAAWNTLILILPAAYPGLVSPVRATRILPLMGTWRGRIPHMVADGGAS